MAISFGRYILSGVAGEYRSGSSLTKQVIENEIVTTSVDVDTAQNTIAVKSIGSVYSFKANGQDNAADGYYSYIHFFVEGTTIALFGAGASDPYGTGWYGSNDLKTSASASYQSGSVTLRYHTLALPVTNGTQIYATPIGYKDDKISYFGVMWSTSPTFEQGADYLHVGYIHSDMFSPTVKELATDLMAGATSVREYPIASEVTLSPQSVEVTAGQAQDIQFTLTGTDGTDYTGIATWAYAITDKNGTVSKDDAPWVSWVSAEDGSVLLRITADAPGGHEITVIAAWGTEDDPQNLWANVTIPVKRVSEQWLYSFKTGLALGLAGKPLPIKKEPVAYLYNGVRLPKLPEYDEEKYPYLVLWQVQGMPFYYYAKACDVRFVYDSDTGFCTHEERGKGVNARIPVGGTSWENFGTEADVLTGTSLSVFWTNTDIFKTGDGTLYLAASEPIPVYE